MKPDTDTYKQQFLEGLYIVTNSGKVKCTNSFFSKFLRNLHKKYNASLTYDDILSIAMYETVNYIQRFTPSSDDWEGMLEGTDLKNLNSFYSGLKPTVYYAVFHEANPDTIQKKKNRTKDSPPYSYYLTLSLGSLDYTPSNNEGESNSSAYEMVKEDNKLLHEQDSRTEQLHSIARFIKDPENRKKYFSKKFNERYDLMKEIPVDDKEGKELILKLTGLSASPIGFMKYNVKNVVEKLDLKEERVILNEEESVSKSMIYYDYFDLLEGLEPEEEVTKLSEWVRAFEEDVELLLYTELDYKQCTEITKLFKEKEDRLTKNMLYRITNIFRDDLNKKLEYLAEVSNVNRTLPDYKPTEYDYQKLNNKTVTLNAYGALVCDTSADYTKTQFREAPEEGKEEREDTNSMKLEEIIADRVQKEVSKQLQESNKQLPETTAEVKKAPGEKDLLSEIDSFFTDVDMNEVENESEKHINNFINNRLAEAVSTNLKALREERGLTQQDLSDMTELNLSTYKSLEQGKRYSLDKVFKVASALGVAPSDLLA